VADASEPEHVVRAARHGLSWNLASAVVTNAIRIAIVAVLGRALAPGDFGVVAAALSVTVFFYSIRDIGVGRALVQRKQVDRGHLATAFAVSSYLGLALSAALFAAAPLIGELYRIEDSIDVLRALSLLYLLRGVAITSRMMFQRAMRFRTIAIIEQITFITGSAISVVGALAGAGPWALVAGYVGEELLATVMYLTLSPPPLSARIDRGKLGDLMSFGAAETASQIVSTLATYGDNYVVGHSLGAVQLGYYTRSYDLIKFPSIVFDSVAGSVLFPMFARFQDDRERLALGFRRATFVNALVLLPASAALLVVAPEAIRLLLGAGWDSSVLPFRVLAVTMLARTGWKVGAMIAGAAGQVRGVAIVNAIYMVSVIGGAIVASRWGIVGVAASTAVAIAISAAGTTYLALRVSGLPVTGLVAAHVPGGALAGVVLALAWLLASSLRAAAAPAAVTFAAVAAASGLALLGGTAILARRERGDFAWLRGELARIRGRLGSGASPSG
jgi:PST family polysaccharide transporter